MKAILTAAGMGSRIDKYIHKPKSTMDVDGEPLIRKTVKMLISKGIEVAVVTGYKTDEIKMSLAGIDVKYYYNPFYSVTNSIGSIWFARDFIDDDTIIANADVYWGKDIFDIISNAEEDCVMVGDKTCTTQGDYFFQIHDGKVIKYGKELPMNERDTEYVGIAKMKKKYVPTFKYNLEKMIGEGKHNLWWENVLYEFCTEHPIVVKDVSGFFWAEIDYIEDYERIIKFVRTKDVASKYKTHYEKFEYS